MRKHLVGLGLASVLTGLTGHAFASGFQLFEDNGINAGNAGAGGAAIAEDASTAYTNPAGLVRLKDLNIVAAVTGIHAKADFSGKTTWGNVYSQQGSVSGGGMHYIPAFHLAAPINNDLVFGFSVTAPFGLETDYPVTDFERYAATRTAISVIDLSPSLGFKVNDKFSVGLGLNVQRVSAVFNSVLGAPVKNPANPSALDSLMSNEASGWGYGWHAGVLYQFSPSTRVGLNYHSQTSYSASGTSTITGPLANPYVPNPMPNVSNGLESDVTLPATTTLSAYHDLNDRWAIMGSVNYTQWSVFDNLRLVNTASLDSQSRPTQNGVANVPQGFRNTWRFAVGTNYRVSDRWLIRGGIGYDQTPTNDEHRSIRLPDGNRILLSLGTRFQPTKAVSLDLGWTHLIAKDANINSTQQVGTVPVSTNGIAKTGADLVGAQVTWNIG